MDEEGDIFLLFEEEKDDYYSKPLASEQSDYHLSAKEPTALLPIRRSFQL